VPIDLRKQEQKTPEYLKLNPDGKVPVLVDDGTVLYESCIINEYLNEKYPNPPLMPADLGKRAKARILTDYGLARLDGPYQKLRVEVTKDPKEQNPQVIGTAKSDLRKLLQRLENELGDQPYLVGDFSADADLLPRFTRQEASASPTLFTPAGKYLQRMKSGPPAAFFGHWRTFFVPPLVFALANGDAEERVDSNRLFGSPSPFHSFPRQRFLSKV
jgi:glutathione S-transferase